MKTLFLFGETVPWYFGESKHLCVYGVAVYIPLILWSPTGSEPLLSIRFNLASRLW